MAINREHDITEWEEWQARFVPLIHNVVSEMLTSRDCSQQCPEIREFRAEILGIKSDISEIKGIVKWIVGIAVATMIGMLTK